MLKLKNRSESKLTSEKDPGHFFFNLLNIMVGVRSHSEQLFYEKINTFIAGG